MLSHVEAGGRSDGVRLHPRRCPGWASAQRPGSSDLTCLGTREHSLRRIAPGTGDHPCPSPTPRGTQTQIGDDEINGGLNVRYLPGSDFPLQS